MDRNEKNDLIRHILDEIKKTDEFVDAFKKDLAATLYPVVKLHDPVVAVRGDIADLLETYAITVLNYTESIIDKDRNYPPYRLSDELEAMHRLSSKRTIDNQLLPFKDDLVDKVKEVMVKHYHDIFDLSGTGFRLLSVNVEYYAWDFISHLYHTALLQRG
ncbi:MAG: hypothetical protein QM786_16675 [Breznakibacter sp.]